MTASNANKNPHWLSFTAMPNDEERIRFLDEIFTRFGAPLHKIATDYFGYASGACVSAYFGKHGLRVSADRKRFNTPGVQQDWQEFCAVSVKPITVQPSGYAPILPTKQQKELDHQRLMDSTVQDDETAAEAVMAAATVSFRKEADSMEKGESKIPTCNLTMLNCGWQGGIDELIENLNSLKNIAGDEPLNMFITIGGKNDTV